MVVTFAAPFQKSNFIVPFEYLMHACYDLFVYFFVVFDKETKTLNSAKGVE